MITVPNFAFILAGFFFVVEEWAARGKSIGWWGAILVVVGLLWGSIIK